jgi:hypothetical protein
LNRFITGIGLTICVVGLAHAATPVAKKSAPAVTAAQPSKPPLPVFVFKGMTAGQPVSEGIFSSCSDEQGGERRCSFPQHDIAGVVSIFPTVGGWNYAKLYDGKLSSTEFVADGDSFAKMLAALVTRYGEPCKTETPKWQSKGGATFDNTVVTWCFRTGHLVLTRMDFQRDYMSLRYRDDESVPPAEKPRIDF